MKLFQMFALSTVVATGLVMAQVPAAPTPAQTAKTTAKVAKEKTPAPAPQTASQIADAKAKGLVWCNSSSKACHESDDKYYGTTKRGEFIAKADVASKGYHMSGETAKSGGMKGAKKTATDVKKP